MISLGLRFSLKGGREGGVRLALTAFGVAVGVALLLFTLSGFNGLKAKDAREGWLLTSPRNRAPSVDERTTDPLWWRLVTDSYGQDSLVRVEVAATGPRAPLTPGLSRLPRAGQYYVSPALARLLARIPADVLGARFPGRRIGIIGERGLTSPDALMAVVGRPVSQLSHTAGASKVRSIETAPKQHDYSQFFRIILGLGAVGLLVPVLVFVGTSTRLAAARREERFAALRLVGATPRQVNAIATVEAALAAVAGTALGFAGFWLFRPMVARIPFTGNRFFTSDLSLGGRAIVVVAVGVPLAAVLAGLAALRRVRVSPLGVSRRVTPRPPRARRLVPVALSLGLLVAIRRFAGGGIGQWVILVAFATIIIGLMVAGPWLTMVGARLLVRLARRDSTLIAARRLSDDPGRAFRAVSGLVLAVFVGTVFIGVVGTDMSRGNGFGTTTLPRGTVAQWLARGDTGAPAPTPARARALLARLHRVAGVRVVLPIYAPGRKADPDDSLGIVPADAWARLGVYGPVRGGSGTNAAGRAAVVTVPVWDVFLDDLKAKAFWQAASPPAGGLTRRPLRAVVVTTDGSVNSVERVRTVLFAALPEYSAPVVTSQFNADSRALIDLLRRMVSVGIILSLAIAGCSMAVSVAGGLLERKRPFSLLRLTGMPLARLRRVVVLEAAVPLVLVALLSAAVGFVAADLILRAESAGFGVSPPALSYYLIMGGGIVAALGVVCATLPLLGKVTAPQAARME